MKVRVETVDGLEEDEVVIRCRSADSDAVRKIRRFALEQSGEAPKIACWEQGRELYLPLGGILFFETEGEHVYAHTAGGAYRVRHRLYELEKILPPYFARASKSAILNLRQVYSVTRDLPSSRLVRFAGSHKEVYASRYYYRRLRMRLNERSR
ncbi:MAG TPA: LytTR family transcriptional regulator [Ruminococcaceae bacterium]|jgi:DNA-binding LytR/AlgR family response regulator|nr:LytTR family transcriptional regulator [Oscillospiraceae bacterium]HCB91173.1 LytTR family transcriptional regulator [Oscillospiraceae bacterium]